MSDRTPWFVAAVAVGALGFVSAGAFHQNVANDISKEKPGKLSVEFVQPAPAIGKLLSIVCAGGVAGCLWIGLRDEEGQAIAPAAVGAAKPAIATQSVSSSTQSTEYDEDPEIEPEEVEQPLERVKESAPKPDQDVGVFDRMYSNRKRHLFIPAETGAGKTTLLLGAIEYGHNLFGDGIEFFGSTAKRSPCLGLEEQIAEDGKPRIIFVDPENPSTILKLLERLRWLRKRLVKRGELRTEAEQSDRPYNPKRNVIILDEWNEHLDIAKAFDREHNLSVERGETRSDTHGELLAFINSFARTGREDEMAIWVFGQDHQCQNAGINTGYRKNFGFIVPAKDGAMTGLEDALTGRSPIVASVAKGRQILAEAEAIATQNPSTGIVYCNIQGHELLTVPYLPDIKRKRLFSAGDRKVVQGRFPKAVGSNYQPEEIEDYWS